MTLETGPSFKPLVPNRDRVSARQYNSDMELLHKIARSLQAYGFIDSSGLLIRKQPVKLPNYISDNKVYKIESIVYSDGTYGPHLKVKLCEPDFLATREKPIIWNPTGSKIVAYAFPDMNVSFYENMPSTTRFIGRTIDNYLILDYQPWSIY